MSLSSHVSVVFMMMMRGLSSRVDWSISQSSAPMKSTVQEEEEDNYAANPSHLFRFFNSLQ